MADENDSKKRRLDEGLPAPPPNPATIKMVLEHFPKSVSVELLVQAAMAHHDVHGLILAKAGIDQAFRKVFFRGLSPEQSFETVRPHFAALVKSRRARSLRTGPRGAARGLDS